MKKLLKQIICLLIAYPVAYAIAHSKIKNKSTLLLLFIVPMWVNFVLRINALKEFFVWIGTYNKSDAWNVTNTIIGMVYDFLPFMILPIYNQLCKIDKSYLEASKDLGANTATVFLKTVVPLSMPGVLSGITMVFMPCISTFGISDMLSRNTIQLFGNLINQAYKMDQWNYAAALSTLMLVIIFFSTVITGRKSKEEENKS